jgi:AcrR family transcriptional regulator
MPKTIRNTTMSDSRRRHRALLEAAARVICERGYEATTIQEVARACGLTKAGLYHHIRSKEDLLIEIMNYGMDVFEEQVLRLVLPIADPVERLRECMARNVLMVTRGWSKEIMIILHEHATLRGEARAQINARKKRYVRFLESSCAEAMAAGRLRTLNPKVAAFAFLGMVLWIYQWYRPDGAITEDQLVKDMQDLFFGSLEPRTTAPEAAALGRLSALSKPEGPGGSVPGGDRLPPPGRAPGEEAG